MFGIFVSYRRLVIPITNVKLNNNSNVKYAAVKDVLYVTDLHHNILCVHGLENAEWRSGNVVDP